MTMLQRILLLMLLFVDVLLAVASGAFAWLYAKLRGALRKTPVHSPRQQTSR